MDSNALLPVGAALGAAALALYYVFCGRSYKEYVGNETDFSIGKMREVEVKSSTGEKVQLLVIRTSKNRFRATGSICTHAKVRMVNGVLNGDRLVCPSHGACFNIDTGDIEDGPVRDKLPTFPVELREGKVYVTLPPSSSLKSLTRETPHMCPASSKDGRHFLIIGAGPAGLSAAETLRVEGFSGRITMLNRERGIPYDRTMLSKSMDVDPAKTELRSREWLVEKGITLREGVTATKVDTAAKVVSLSNGESIPYDKLLCASGGPARTFRADAAEPGPPPIPYAELTGIFPLRTLAHGGALQAYASSAVERKQPIVIQGSSFIGMEAAAYLMESLDARDVTVIGMEACPFERTLGSRVGEFMQALHEKRGVKFLMGAVVTRFIPSEADPSRVGGAEVKFLKPGTPPLILPAACVIVGAGIIPATEYLSGAQGVSLVKEMPGGVAVNEYLEAAPNVYAVGDIANIPLRYGLSASRWRIEHWNVAIDQGRVAAQNMARGGGLNSESPSSAKGGRPMVPYHSVPFFWTYMYGKYLRCAGFCKAPERVVLKGKLDTSRPENSRFQVYYIVGNRVEAVITYNEAVGAGCAWSAAALELIKMDKLPPGASLEDSETPLDLCSLLEVQETVLEAPGRSRKKSI